MMYTKSQSLKIPKYISAICICGLLASLCILIDYTAVTQTYEITEREKFLNNLLNQSMNDEIQYTKHQYTIDDINNQLFCGSKMKDGYDKLLTHIDSLQNPKDCYDRNNKFFIWEHQCNVGLFASLECIVSYFAQAIFANRTFLVKGEWIFSDKNVMQKFKCSSNSMDCYFLPVSSCNADDILEYEWQKGNNRSIVMLTKATKNYYEHMNGSRKWFNYQVGTSMPFITEKIVYLRREFGWSRLSPNKALNAQLYLYYGLPLENARRCFTAVVEAYLLRMRPYIKDIVNKIIFDSYMINTNIYNKSIDGFRYNMSESVSIMIRWGDKCSNKELENKKYPHPEMECYTYHEYMILIKTLKLIVPELKYVIVTCDSSEIITNITKEYKDWMDDNGMIFVTNIGDIMQGSSVIDRFSSTNNVLMVLISMLSTIKIQFGSKYYFLQQGSFWNTGTFNLINKLNCVPFHGKLAFDVIRNVDRIHIYLAGNIGHRTVSVQNKEFKNKLEENDIDFAQILNFISNNHKLVQSNNYA